MKKYLAIKINQSIDYRIDKYIKEFIFKNIKHIEIEKALRKKEIILNDLGEKKLTASMRSKDIDEILIDQYFYNYHYNLKINESNLINKNIPLKLMNLIKESIFFENKDLLILNKPSNITVQSGTKISYSIDMILKKLYPNEDIKIVHRLDKHTTGLIIFAKNKEYASFLAKKFFEKTNSCYLGNKDSIIEKKYILIAREISKSKHANDFKKNKKIIICEKLKQVKIGLEEIVIVENNLGLNAKTEFHILNSLIKNDEKFFYIEANLFSGRKHQIRAHLAHIGFCILGDYKYEKFLTKSDSRKISLGDFFLHSKSLKFDNFSFEIPEPKHFKEFFM